MRYLYTILYSFLLASLYLSDTAASSENSSFEEKELEIVALSSPENSISLIPPATEEKLSHFIKFSSTEKNKVGYIVINDFTSGINESTWLFVKQALAYYKKNKPIFIILELNTPGGEVFAAQKISDALKEIDTQEDIPVVAFINNWAISAGAMLAYSSRFIAITKDASMGAAEPVIATESGEMKAASEKVNSALRSDFANRARFFDRNPYIAEAMVDKDTILVLRHGKIIKLDTEAQMQTSGPDTDILISPKGKLLTLDAVQMMQYGVADLLLLPKKLSSITPEETASGHWPASKTLLFQDPFFAKIPHAEVDAYRMDWKTHFFVLLAHPVVSSLLMLGLMLGIYLEISTPGFGVPAILGLSCLFLIILSSLSLDIANWLEVILVVTGMAIILVDLFFLPTFGLLGILGSILFVAGLFGMLLPEIGSISFSGDSDTLNEAGKAFISRLAWLCGTLLLGVILILFLARYITPTATSWTRLVLTGGEQEGYIAGENPSLLPPPGSKGIVFSTLRPTGKVLIGEKILDAISSGGFIEKETPIRVLRIEGSVLVVQEDSLL
jgi:membrane-bound ClpP family serine protease